MRALFHSEGTACGFDWTCVQDMTIPLRQHGIMMKWGKTVESASEGPEALGLIVIYTKAGVGKSPNPDINPKIHTLCLHTCTFRHPSHRFIFIAPGPCPPAPPAAPCVHVHVRLRMHVARLFSAKYPKGADLQGCNGK